MKKEKDKIDKITTSLMKDRQGYDAYRADLRYRGNIVTFLIFTDITHRRFTDKLAKIVREKYEVVDTVKQ